MDLLAEFARFRPSLLAAVLIFCRRLLQAHQASFPETTACAVELVGCKRSQAYAMVAVVKEALLALDAPCEPASARDQDAAYVEVVEAVRDFVMAHPGCVATGGGRTTYCEAFRLFVVELRQPARPAHGISVDALARAANVPLGTLKDWLKAPAIDTLEVESHLETALSTTDPAISTILARWPEWSGTFTEFCRHLRAHERIDAGNTFIARVLEAAGLRTPQRQKPARPWSRRSFQELFPNAQWIGDGSQFFVEIDEQRFVFNLEAIVDASSNAVLAVEVTDTENEAAVLDAFDAARQTVHDQPLALSLDNKPSNHTARIKDHLEPAELLASTPASPTAKACVEGFFGLFEQAVPPMTLETSERRELARRILKLVATSFARGRNGRPRKKLDGKSPAQLHAEHEPSAEDIERARAWIDELKRRRDKLERTRRRREDPISRALIEEALLRHGLEDPHGRLARNLSSFSQQAIVQAVAIFDGKAIADTLPKGVDKGRYLGGIIRNVHHRLEQEAIADALLACRLRQRDLSLAPLLDELARIDADQDDPSQRITSLVDRALKSDAQLDFRFYVRTAKQRLAQLKLLQARELFRYLSRRIAATFSTPPRRRQHLLEHLSEGLTLAA